MRQNTKIALVLLLAAGAYFALKKPSVGEAANNLTSGAPSGGGGFDILGGIKDAIVKATPLGMAENAVAPLATQAAAAPSQIWNSLTGNQTANNLQNAAAGLNQYLQQQTGTAVPYVQAQTGSTGITTVSPTQNIPSSALASIQKAIEQSSIQAAGTSGGMSLAQGGVAYIPPSQAVVNSSNVAAHQAAGTVAPVSQMSQASRMALGLI